MLALLLCCLTGVTVELEPQAHVRGTELVLADVARVQGEATEATRVAQFSLGYAPAPGYARSFDLARLQVELQGAFPGLELRVEGAASCRVEPQVETVGAAQLEAQARAALTTSFEGRAASFRLTTPVEDLIVPRGDAAPQLVAHIAGADLDPGARNVPIDVRVDGETYRTLWTRWEIEVVELRPVLVRAVRRGEELSPRDVEVREIKARATISSADLTGVALNGAVALRDLAAGEPVTERDVDRKKVVRRGDLVHLEIQKGAVTARAAAVAQQDGRIGDRIRIVTSSSARELSAVVVSSDRVTIRMTSDKSGSGTTTRSPGASR